MKNQQSGFTLIELVMVIVILGILTATALPKFIDLQSDARASVISGVESSMRGAASMVYAKALVAGQTGATGSVTVNGATVNVVYGYPATTAITGLLDLQPAADFSVTATTGTVQHAGAATATSCQVKYTEPTAADTAPAITATVTACN